MIIEKNIPVPTKSSRGRKPRYPLNEMEVGDSFRVAEENFFSVSSRASLLGKRDGKKFTVTKHDEAYRCWRIA